MDVDELFGLPLEGFIPEPTALARSLRGEGRRDEAAEVAATRKPSVAAWAVNQLVRTQGRAVKELFAAGDALRAAQEQVVRGEGDGGGLRSAAERERAVVDELVAAARGLLSSEGHGLSEAVLTRVSDTLNAAALDEAAREQVREGRLERELRYVGFGGGLGAGGAPVGPTAKPRRQPAPKPPPHKTKTEAQGKAKA